MRHSLAPKIGFFAFLLTSSLASAATVTRLRCEYLTNPIGIDSSIPRFSWEILSTQRGERQSAYQIVVTSDDDVMWDSGKVSSDRTNDIVYAGKAFGSAQRCQWKVRVWDRDANASEFSAPATFEMALINPASWHAKWIGGDGKPGGAAPMLRRTFNLNGNIKRARLYICGLGYYDARLNGQPISDRVLDPGYTNYAKRVLYSTFDVTEQLKPGKNAIAVTLGTGWYDCHVTAVWHFENAPWRDRPKLLAQLRVDYDDGRSETLATDETWKRSTGPTTFDSIYIGENYDARLEKPGWDTADFDDSSWQPARMTEPPKGKLVAQSLPPIRIIRRIAPARITEPKPGVFLFDLGENIAGVPELTVRGPAGATVTLTCGERLAADGTLDQKDIGEHVMKDNPTLTFQSDSYILKGGEAETWHPRFTYHGFQYVQVSGFPGKPTAENLRALVMHTDLPRVGKFECSNPLFHKIFDAGVRAYLSNAMSIPTDCPHREKNGWTGDAHLAADQGLFNFDGITFYEKWLNDIADSQTPAGDVAAIVPTGGWGYGIGPAWDSAYILIPWYLYQFYGDTRALETHYDGMKRYVDYLVSKSKNNIIDFGLGDWVPYETQTPNAVTSTGYFYRDATIVAETAKLLGKKDDAVKYAALAESIRKSFNQTFFNDSTGVYANGSQTALSCALYQGLVEPANQNRVFDHLLSAIKSRDDHLDCGILGTKYVMNVLLDRGRADVGYRIANQRTLPSWGWWIDQGATTLWENWRGEASRNHIMFGDVLAWFYKALAGINPDPASPGFKHVIIRPNIVGDLTSARGEYHSIHGNIISAWRLKDQMLELDVTIPPNTAATVYLPAASADAVTQSSDVKTDRIESGCAVFSIGSGEYHFAAKQPPPK